MGVFIFAFTATGKSTVARKYRNVIDMESTHYKYIDNNAEDESLKSTVRDINREWPYNYFKELKKVKDKYDYILIADEICNDFLIDNKYDYWYVYPKRELKHEYLDRCKKRGNNEEAHVDGYFGGGGVRCLCGGRWPHSRDQRQGRRTGAGPQCGEKGGHCRCQEAGG